MSALWLNVLAGGILVGVVYGLVALGLTIIFGVMRIINFAHGEMVVAGAYVGYLCSTLLGLPVLYAAFVAAVLLFGFGFLLQILFIRHFAARPPHFQFIVFIGLALVITGLHLVAFGPEPRPVATSLAFDVIEVSTIRLDVVRVQAALVALMMIVVFGAFLRFSTFGQYVRAAADNPLGSLVVGLNVPRVFGVTAGIGAACAGVAGALVAPIFDIQPYLALEFTMVAFVTVIVGGLGSFAGALVAGLLIGLAEAVAALVFDPSLKSALSYALLVIVLLLRPRGLFGASAA